MLIDGLPTILETTINAMLIDSDVFMANESYETIGTSDNAI